MPAAPLPIEEAERLAALRSYDAIDVDLEAVFDDLVRLAARLTGCPIAAVSLIDAERQVFTARCGLDVHGTPRDLAFCAYAILDPGEVLIVRDASQDSRFTDNPLVTGELGIRFYAGVPLVNPQGHALGTLCVIDSRPRDLSPEEHEALGELAHAVGAALEVRRTMARLHLRARMDRETGLANRAAFFDELERIVARSQQGGHAFQLLLLRVGGQEGSGSLAGGGRLRGVGQMLLTELNQDGLAARIGTDAFATLVAGAEVDGCTGTKRLIERLRAAGWKEVLAGSVVFRTPPGDATDALSAAEEAVRAAAAQHEGFVCREYAQKDGGLAAS